MKKRIVQTFLAAILVSILAVKPVLATPSVDDMQTDKEQTQNEVSALQRQLVENLEKISGLEEQIGQKEDEISQASVDLEEAINKQNKQYDAMKLRIKYMYEAGNMDALETFLSAESFSELVNQAEYIQNIHSYDRQKSPSLIRISKMRWHSSRQLQRRRLQKRRGRQHCRRL